MALGAALGALAVAMPAQGSTEELTSSWAKINICDSSQMGARAQLAGDGSTDQMQVRFSAQWLSPDGWVPLAGQATSPWQDAGSAEFTWAQAGWTFNLTIPAPAPDATTTPDATAATYQLRAVAEMELGSGRTSTQTTGACVIGG